MFFKTIKHIYTGVIMNNVEFMHYRSANGSKGGATVAIYPQAATMTALISIARCGPADIFNKKIGRDVARGRIAAYLGGRESSTKHVEQILVPEGMDLKASVDIAVFEQMTSHGLS